MIALMDRPTVYATRESRALARRIASYRMGASEFGLRISAIRSARHRMLAGPLDLAPYACA